MSIDVCAVGVIELTACPGTGAPGSPERGCEPMTRTTPYRTLEIFVTASCPGCERARANAATIRGWDLACLGVVLRDLGAPDTVRPAAVFAVPTYVLDGCVISLGNPDIGYLRSLLASGPD